MPIWASILLIAGLGGLAVASVFAIVHHTHRRVPARQVPQADPERDISAPIPMDVAHADDRLESSEAMTARDVEQARQRETRPRVRDRRATYEIALAGEPAHDPTDVVANLPPAEVGVVLFYQGSFWRVDEIQPATSQEADGRLLVSRTTDAPKPHAA